MKATSFILMVFLNFGYFNNTPHQQAESSIKAQLDMAWKIVYSDPTKSINIINALLPSLANENLQSYRLQANLTKGRSLLNLGQYELAYETLYTNYEECPASNEDLKMKYAVFLGDTYRSLHLEEKAMEFVHEAIKIAERTNHQSTLALCYNVMGLIHINLNKNKEAEKFFFQALKINKQLKLNKSIASNLNNLCLYPNNTPLEKVKLLEEAIQINTKLGASWSIAENYNNMGVQYLYAKDFKKALACLSISDKIAKTLNAKELISDNHRYRSWVYEAMGNYTEAFKHFKKLYDIETEMLSDKRVSKLESERTNKILAKKQEELHLNQKEYEIKSLKNERIIFLLGAVSILLTAGFLSFKYKKTRQFERVITLKRLAEKEQELTTLKLQQAEVERKSMETELVHSKNDLTNFACYIKSKNDFLEKLKEDIKQANNMSEEDIKRHLKSIRSNIVQYQNSSNEQNLLIEEIESVNAEFISRLSQKHPDLTKNEKNLASMLRIELSTKDIANIIGSTPKTVNMARYRLRKKLNLDSDEDLSDYMNKI